MKMEENSGRRAKGKRPLCGSGRVRVEKTAACGDISTSSAICGNGGIHGSPSDSGRGSPSRVDSIYRISTF